MRIEHPVSQQLHSDNCAVRQVPVVFLFVYTRAAVSYVEAIVDIRGPSCLCFPMQLLSPRLDDISRPWHKNMTEWEKACSGRN
jgi:hypothetical protein